MEKEILTTKEAMEYFRVTKVTLLKMIHAGRIRAFKVGNAYRFKKADLEEDLMVNKPDDMKAAAQ